MQEALYKKTDLSRVFGEILTEYPDQKELLMKLWGRVKGLDDIKPGEKVDFKSSLEARKAEGDNVASFAYEFAAYVYMLMTDKDVKESDVYWSQVCDAMGTLSRKYGGTGSLAEQWSTAMFFVADDIVAGKRTMEGELWGKVKRS